MLSPKGEGTARPKEIKVITYAKAPTTTQQQQHT